MILSFSFIGFIFYISLSKILFKRKKIQHLTGAVLKMFLKHLDLLKNIIILNKHRFFKFFLSLNDEKYRHTFLDIFQVYQEFYLRP